MNKTNTLDTYNYSLPNELIAQYPCDVRDESRLLCYEKETENISHNTFKDISNILQKGDVLVLNNTKVIPARFYVDTRPSTIDNGKKVEIVLVRPLSSDNLTWLVIAGPQKKLRKTNKIFVEGLEIEVVNDQTLKFKSSEDLKKILNGVGKLPLPHYIDRENETVDLNRYQTVFAKEEGAIAAPTAALHFTDELLKTLEEKGVEIKYITLHVGPGTFMPIRTDDINEHNLMPEEFSVEKETWESISKAKKENRRIIACGTTVVRTLEYLATKNTDNRQWTTDNEHRTTNNRQWTIGNVQSKETTRMPKVHCPKISGLCDLYITPNYEFKIVDGIITNFHLPKTSLLILISSFVGWDKLKSIYEAAIEEKYRFYSYGDASLLL